MVLYCYVVGGDTDVECVLLGPTLHTWNSKDTFNQIHIKHHCYQLSLSPPTLHYLPTIPSLQSSTYHSLLFSLFEGAKVGEDFEGRAPLLELKLPVQHHRGGNYDQVGTPVALVTRKVGQESNGLGRQK